VSQRNKLGNMWIGEEEDWTDKEEINGRRPFVQYEKNRGYAAHKEY